MISVATYVIEPIAALCYVSKFLRLLLVYNALVSCASAISKFYHTPLLAIDMS